MQVGPGGFVLLREGVAAIATAIPHVKVGERRRKALSQCACASERKAETARAVSTEETQREAEKGEQAVAGKRSDRQRQDSCAVAPSLHVVPIGQRRRELDDVVDRLAAAHRQGEVTTAKNRQACPKTVPVLL